MLLVFLPFVYLAYLGHRRVNAAAVDFSPTASAKSFIIPRDTARPPDPVDEFAAFVAVADTARDDADEHDHTSIGLRMLVDGIATLGGADAPSIIKALANLRRQAVALATHVKGSSARDADRVRMAFVSAADIIETVQHASYPEAAAPASSVRRAAAAVHGGRSLVDQRPIIAGFFQTAREALRAMHPSGTPRGGP